MVGAVLYSASDSRSLARRFGHGVRRRPPLMLQYVALAEPPMRGKGSAGRQDTHSCELSLSRHERVTIVSMVARHERHRKSGISIEMVLAIQRYPESQHRQNAQHDAPSRSRISATAAWRDEVVADAASSLSCTDRNHGACGCKTQEHNIEW